MPADFNEIIVNEIIAKLTPREKSIFAYMDNPDIDILEACLDRYNEGKGSSLKDGKHVIKRIWAKLFDSHRLRVIE